MTSNEKEEDLVPSQSKLTRREGRAPGLGPWEEAAEGKVILDGAEQPAGPEPTISIAGHGQPEWKEQFML